MEFANKNTIKLDKEISDLDRFVIRFIEILKKYTDYVIISGYVAILLGRSRTTEDIDIFIEEISLETFRKFYSDMLKNGYWCLNSGDGNEIYSYLSHGLAARFALDGKTVPNFEVKIAKKPLDKESFKDRLTAVSDAGQVYISSLERQIAFKRYYLKSDKDVEDALHIESLFKKHLDTTKINKYREMLMRQHEVPKSRKEQ